MHSPCLMAVQLSLGYYIWFTIGWRHPLNDWLYLNEECEYLQTQCILDKQQCIVGSSKWIPTVFKKTLTIPCYLLAVRVVQGDCERVLWQITCTDPDSKIHGTNMGPIWGRQDPGGPHVDAMNFAVWVPLVTIMDHFRKGARSFTEPLILHHI